MVLFESGKVKKPSDSLKIGESSTIDWISENIKIFRDSFSIKKFQKGSLDETFFEKQLSKRVLEITIFGFVAKDRKRYCAY